MSTHFQLIVFDWDGTLIDSVDRIVRCFRACFETLGLPLPDDQHIKSLIGLPLTSSFYELVSSDESVTQEEFVACYRQIWHDEARLPLSPLFDGVPQLLEDLSKRYELCVATGKSRAGLERELGHYNLAHYFRETRCADETKPKPHPEMLVQLMEAYKVTVGETVMVGDAVLDLDMANQAGMAAIGVFSGGQDADTLAKCKPSQLFENVLRMRETFL